jgi:hypothetical protein
MASTPVKLTNREYTCSICGHKGANRYEVTTYAGNKKRKCWTCLSPKERETYTAAHPARPVPTECTTCGKGIIKINGTIPCCEGCTRPMGLCKCTPLTKTELPDMEDITGFPYRIEPKPIEHNSNSLQLLGVDPLPRCKLRPKDAHAKMLAERAPAFVLAKQDWQDFKYCAPGGKDSCGKCLVAKEYLAG